jgi:hypothetical protein
MELVINELKEHTLFWICHLLDGSIHDNGSYMDMENYVRYNKHTLADNITESPFWSYCMDCRHCYFHNSYDDINEKVRYDYAVNLTSDIIQKNTYETRQIMWREAQKEKMLLFYDKIPTDILNEILSFM